MAQQFLQQARHAGAGMRVENTTCAATEVGVLGSDPVSRPGKQNGRIPNEFHEIGKPHAVPYISGLLCCSCTTKRTLIFPHLAPRGEERLSFMYDWMYTI